MSLVKDTNRPRSRLGAKRMITAAVLATMLSPAAEAGSCTYTSRSGTIGSSSKPAAETTVVNAMSSETLKIEIYRGDTQKWTKFLKPGEKGSFTTHLSKSGGSATLRVQIYSELSSFSKECSYRMRNTGNDDLVWTLPTGAESVCPGTGITTFSVACEKSFNSDHLKYKTRFTLSDA
ncbi:hypothetical protein [Elongatibacter sediminis]|uniref:Secreted protein n=1 Tax=Elongatibacter sediminis TaxID=3119006 RepID=A0AAW9RET0_9GAMM